MPILGNTGEPPVFAIVADVTRLVENPPADAIVQEYLDLAHARLLSRVPSIPARVASGALSAVLVKGVLVDMVKRVLDRRDGAGMESQSVGAGPFQIGGKFAAGSDRIRVLDSDLIDLVPSSGAVGTIRTPLGW